MLDHIGEFLAQHPRAKIVPPTSTDFPHAKLRFGWKMVCRTGRYPFEGVDFGELTVDGKILHIVGFFTRVPSRQ